MGNTLPQTHLCVQPKEEQHGWASHLEIFNLCSIMMTPFKRKEVLIECGGKLHKMLLVKSTKNVNYLEDHQSTFVKPL